MDISRLKGSIPPLITPFRNGLVDYEAYQRMVQF
jgi:4-hydroxy-tetrahydrodipicolinate synthase